MQRLTAELPELGRWMIMGAAPSVQFWFASGPTASTFIGELSAAVVGSVTTKFKSGDTGVPAVNEIVCGVALNGTTTKATGLESAPGVPGFCTCSVAVPAIATSSGASAIEHEVADWHVVVRGAPLNKITEAPDPLPAANPAPSTLSGKPSTAPAVTLEGRTASIDGPLVIDTKAVADFVGSAALVAVTAIVFGEGAVDGEV